MNSAHQCFCDLAPFYVLDLLDEAERDWVERQILEIPELAEEFHQYEVAATALPYGADLKEVAGDLKGRLFDALNLAPPEDISPVAEAPEDSHLFTVRFRDIQWKAHPVPGVEVSIFYTDRIARRISGVLKASPGMQYPPHRHRETEEIYMISGDLRIGTEVYGAGDYIRSHPGSVHAPYSHDGCMFFFNTSMDDEYFETERVLS
ncbi:cupin domain-containing protein [Altericista sp. CCNU0014]|uniref:cupin domain-containing protein n=1 Tax=Altericista sp. CCNU0014 TaxID=3082949 RepID=UPI00384C040A